MDLTQQGYSMVKDTCHIPEHLTEVALQDVH